MRPKKPETTMSTDPFVLSRIKAIVIDQGHLAREYEQDIRAGTQSERGPEECGMQKQDSI